MRCWNRNPRTLMKANRACVVNPSVARIIRSCPGSIAELAIRALNKYCA